METEALRVLEEINRRELLRVVDQGYLQQIYVALCGVVEHLSVLVVEKRARIAISLLEEIVN